jgi:hypothetical protein
MLPRPLQPLLITPHPELHTTKLYLKIWGYELIVLYALPNHFMYLGSPRPADYYSEVFLVISPCLKHLLTLIFYTVDKMSFMKCKALLN